MVSLEIKKYPDKVLKEKSVSVENIDGNLHRLIYDMIETMYAAQGIGLAANQVGVLKRVCVIDISIREEKRPLIVLLNPELITKEGVQEGEEGCLSVPGYLTNIKRAERVFVKGLDREGRPLEIDAAGFLARVLQHEIDHLNGLTIIDRISLIKREFFKKRYKKQLRMMSDSRR